MTSSLLEVLADHDELADLDPAERRLALRSALAATVPEPELAAAVRTLSNEIDAYGPVTGEMNDPDVTDVLVNGADEIWVERRGALVRSSASFDNDAHLISFVGRLLLRSGGRADLSAPICDARLPDGTRLHVVVPPVTDGPKVSLRKFPRAPMTLEQLHQLGMMCDVERSKLERAVANRSTICICGSTGSGKTTLLNALLGLVPDDERVVVIEQARELRPACAHAVVLATVDSNHEKKGGIDLSHLVRAALRMRPDRLVVGEVRGPEAGPALDALSTGHPGSMLTIHAGSPAAALRRLAELAAGGHAGEASAVERRVRDAFDLVVFIRRSDGRRAVATMLEP